PELSIAAGKGGDRRRRRSCGQVRVAIVWKSDGLRRRVRPPGERGRPCDTTLRHTMPRPPRRDRPADVVMAGMSPPAPGGPAPAAPNAERRPAIDQDRLPHY